MPKRIKIKDINAGLVLKLAAVVLIVISAAFMVKSVRIYKKYAAAKVFYASSLKRREDLSARLESLERVKPPEAVFGGRTVKTYLLTFLSFVNYINSKGYAAGASLTTPPSLKAGLKTPKVAVQADSYHRLGSYITDSSSFYAVKKIGLSLKIKDIPDIKSVLKIIGDVQELFPARISSIFITGKIAVINFNIYGGE